MGLVADDTQRIGIFPDMMGIFPVVRLVQFVVRLLFHGAHRPVVSVETGIFQDTDSIFHAKTGSQTFCLCGYEHMHSPFMISEMLGIRFSTFQSNYGFGR